MKEKPNRIGIMLNSEEWDEVWERMQTAESITSAVRQAFRALKEKEEKEPVFRLASKDIFRKDIVENDRIVSGLEHLDIIKRYRDKTLAVAVMGEHIELVTFDVCDPDSDEKAPVIFSFVENDKEFKEAGFYDMQGIEDREDYRVISCSYMSVTVRTIKQNDKKRNKIYEKKGHYKEELKAIIIMKKP